MYLLDYVLANVRKPLARRGAKALFRDIWIYDRKDIEF